MILLWIFVSIIIFSIIVLIHEYGHFKAARIFWVKVEEFWLWIPPRAKKLFIDKQWTLFSLNWLPLWWFVKLTWEQAHSFLLYDKNNTRLSNTDLISAIKNSSDIFDKKWQHLNSETLKQIKEMLDENTASYNLSQKPAWQQSIIILAGVAMNFLLAIVIFSILFFIWVKPIWVNTQFPTDREILLIPTLEQAKKSGLIQSNSGIIVQPLSGSIAEKAGLKENDIILKVFEEIPQSPEELVEIIARNSEKKISFLVKRNDDLKTIIVNPGDNGKIGVYLGENLQLNSDFRYNFSAWESVKYGILETYNQTMLTFRALWSLIRKIVRPETKTERTEAIQQVSWPIWIVDFVSWALESWIIFLIIIWAIISINLAVFNLLPIPALDWGRFFFIVINACVLKIIGKKAINERLEWYIHVWFFLFLILLSILIAYNDILKISAS